MRRDSVILLAVMVLLCSSAHRLSGADAPALSVPVFGIEYVPPAPAVEKALRAPGWVGFYELKETDAGAAVLIEVMASTGSSRDDVARVVAKYPSALIQGVDFQIGSEKATKLTSRIKAESFDSLTTYVVTHNDSIYLFSAYSTPTAKSNTALDGLVHTVKFIPVESPLAHLTENAAEPYTVFNRFTLQGPQCLRPAKATQTELQLGVYDRSGKAALKNPLTINFSHIQVPGNKTFADLSEAYSKGLQTRLKAPAPFDWHDQKGVAGLHVSQPMTMTATMANGKEISLMNRFCMLELAPGDFVQIVFTVGQMPEAEAKTYLEVSDRMLASVTVLPATAP